MFKRLDAFVIYIPVFLEGCENKHSPIYISLSHQLLGMLTILKFHLLTRAATV